MDSFRRWLTDAQADPIIGTVLFLGVFLIRMQAWRWLRPQPKPKGSKRKGVASG